MIRTAVALALAFMAVPELTAAQLPAAIAAPGQNVLTTLHGEGAQIYECRAATDGKLGWQLREPIATLFLDGKTVGRHYLGPAWEYIDGSLVVGKIAAIVFGATPEDIPWLRLQVTEHRGSGMFSGVTTVQRINTKGGVVQGSCEHAGAYLSVPYSADYVFLGERA
jgi:hypothetical protein